MGNRGRHRKVNVKKALLTNFNNCMNDLNFRCNGDFKIVFYLKGNVRYGGTVIPGKCIKNNTCIQTFVQNIMHTIKTAPVHHIVLHFIIRTETMSTTKTKQLLI